MLHPAAQLTVDAVNRRGIRSWVIERCNGDSIAAHTVQRAMDVALAVCNYKEGPAAGERGGKFACRVAPFGRTQYEDDGRGKKGPECLEVSDPSRMFGNHVVESCGCRPRQHDWH